ncbi:MAG: metallophosphoesterase family protein [Planctomycetaceae bacterium]|nr:metallophosphoesterase family protein [Planctomycetaceae bacterium]
MLIGILSDSHDRQARLERAVAELQAAGAEALIHCGDMTSASMLQALTPLPAYFCFGNCDNTLGLQREAKQLGIHCLGDGGEIELSGRRLAVTHSHLSHEVARLLQAEPDYLFSGHSHIANDWQEGAIRRINPGALHRAARYTVVLLDLDSGEAQWLEIPE